MQLVDEVIVVLYAGQVDIVDVTRRQDPLPGQREAVHLELRGSKVKRH